MKTEKTAINKSSQYGRKLAANMAIMAASLLPLAAEAKISNWFSSSGSEILIITKWVVIALAAIGVILSGIGVISMVMAKKNNQPITYQGWLILGGVVSILLIPFIIALASSISGEDNAANILNNTLNSSGNAPKIYIP